jgi:hypothetical protein
VGFRAHRALIPLALAASAHSLAAQNPPAAPSPPPPRDSLAREQVFDDVFPVGTSALAPRVTLNERTVYRVEIQPATATVRIRAARRPSLPPLFMVPLEGGGPPGAGQTAAFLVVPRSTEEYRIDVANYGTEPVRLRVETDPREGSRWARIHTEGFRLPVLAAAVRAMYLTRFRDVNSTPLDSLYGYTTTPRSAVGLKTCLAVVPNGRILPDRVGGCALALTFWRRGSGRNFFTLGIEPEVVVSRAAGAEVALSPQLAFGNTTGGAPRASYVFLGLGVRYARELTRKPALGFQAEANLLDIRSLPASLNPARASAVAVSLGAGLVLAL